MVGPVSAGQGLYRRERGPGVVSAQVVAAQFVAQRCDGCCEGFKRITVTMDRSTGSFGAFVRDAAGKLIA